VEGDSAPFSADVRDRDGEHVVVFRAENEYSRDDFGRKTVDEMKTCFSAPSGALYLPGLSIGRIRVALGQETE
jgi:hypothetical protein